jgi:hypothetical protein
LLEQLQEDSSLSNQDWPKRAHLAADLPAAREAAARRRLIEREIAMLNPSGWPRRWATG